MNNRVLVVLHVYYPEQVQYFISKLSNITGCEWDLMVTGNNWPQDVVRMLLAFKPDTHFFETPNVGYDVWPFINVIKTVDLGVYSFVIKLHTKNSDPNNRIRFNGETYSGTKWRDFMVDALLASPAAFHAVKKVFETRPDIGIVYSMNMNMTSKGNTVEDSSMLSNELLRLGIKPASMDYCAGTIFAVRASALSFLKDERITESIFPPSGESHSSGTMTHVYERILCMAVSSCGYGRFLVHRGIANMIFLKLKNLVQPALEWLFSINHYGDKYDKYLTLFGIRILLSRGNR